MIDQMLLFLSMTDFDIIVISSIWYFLSLDSKMPIDLPWALKIFFLCMPTQMQTSNQLWPQCFA